MRRALAALLFAAAPVSAAAWNPPTTAPPKTSVVERVSLDLAFGYFDMLGAQDSAKAVFGSAGGFTFGGDLAYRFGKQLRYSVGVGVRVFKKDGERVFVADANSPVFRLGHPLDVSLVPIQATFAYRFQPTRVFGVGLTPYLGAGASLTSYSEESTVGGLTESDSRTKFGGQGVLGVELGEGQVRFGLEAVYSVVPSTLGVGGVSRVYDESGVGGLSLLGKLIFTKGRH